jgi:hypothetical protein
MASRKAVEPAPPAKDSTGLMGWCMSFAEDHGSCRTQYVDMNGGTRTCSCPCHSA